jgi:hypothetical protein
MDGPPHPFRLELSSFLLCSGTVFLSSMWEESPTLVQHGILPPASMKREEELVVKSQSGERCCCRGSVAMSWWHDIEDAWANLCPRYICFLICVAREKSSIGWGGMRGGGKRETRWKGSGGGRVIERSIGGIGSIMAGVGIGSVRSGGIKIA